MSKKVKAAKEARELFLTGYQGILSTHSVDVSGYPFGSVVPYCVNKIGEPVILISTIAQHTKNILANSKVSLITTDSDVEDLQAVGRVTYIGDAEKLDINDTDSIERYYNYFPQSRDYHKTHDFNFYVIKAVRIRFIGGFGQIHWIESDDFIETNPFDFDEEKRMLDHMNADHLEAIRHYCDLYSIVCHDNQEPIMIGIDSEGFHLRIDKRIYRITFDEPVASNVEVREALVDLARKPISEPG